LPELKLENIKKLKDTDVEKIKKVKDDVSKIITSKTAADYNQAVKNGMSSEAALTVAKKDGGAVLKEFNRIDSDIDQLNKETTFALDADGNITLDENQGSGERYSVKQTVADIKADTTVYQNKDGSYTLDQSAPGNVRVNDAVVSLDNRTRSNTQAIQNHSRQLQEHNARLNSQQRQIRENHEEMKRAAAQSAALSGLFQPYSVGKFNATAALGGYSDKQAVAVGVGYRFNEQTAAKAGIAASDGDVSYNVGVNFEF
ncbi:YadA C-terminal domain-containing protein, partial [Escherichia coli]|nr:YadA C-terminal domain-containing protein [Escherichia coli]